MELKKFEFNKPANRPFIFASFVSTLDGKIIVKAPGYWPIGSSHDYAFFTHLRAHVDVIVDGKNTAYMFGKKTIETITSTSFKEQRKQLGKEKDAEYVVVTSKPDRELLSSFDGAYKPYIATTEQSSIEYVQSRIIRIEGEGYVKLTSLMSEFAQRAWEYIYIDGGPTLIAELLDQNLLDELFVTIAPKIFGSETGKTMTLAEGKLFEPDKIKQFKLISSEVIGDEVFVRYRITEQV